MSDPELSPVYRTTVATTTNSAADRSRTRQETAAPQRIAAPVARARFREFAGRHWLFGLLLIAGALLRAATMYAYWPAFWFRNDSNGYISGASNPQPDGFGGANGIGYPAFLWLLHKTNSLAVVSIAQHLLGIGLAVLIYAFLRRRGLPGWLASLGAATQLLDAQVIALEHYVLADSLFTVLITTAAVLLLWNDKPGVLACVASGVLLVGGVLTRTVGIGLAGIFALYLIVRWVGWKRVAAFALAVLVLLGGYLSWMHSSYGSFSFSRMQPLYLYSRTAEIADCDRLRLTSAERAFCPTTPVGQREDRGDWYLWNGPQMGLQKYTPAQLAAIGGFAKQVIEQQPGDYLGLIARDTAKYLLPDQPVTSWDTCVGGWWAMPAQLTDNSTFQTRCKALMTYDSFNRNPVWPPLGGPSRSRNALAWYSNHVTVPPLALGITVMLALAGIAWRWRRPDWRADLPAVLLVGSGLAMLVLAVATSEYSVRYGIPSTTLMTAGGALALYQLRTVFRRRGASPSDVDRRKAS